MSKHRKKCREVLNPLLEIDRFSSPVKINVNGKSEISSKVGTFATVVLLVVLGAYAINKF